MKVIRGTPSSLIHPPCALTIGNFDGVHQGHQALLSRLSDYAAQNDLKTCVLTFDPHPKEFFTPDNAPARIYSLRDKLSALKDCGIDSVVVEHFNANFAKITADEFVEKILIQGLNAKYIVIGDDFHYGAKRQGNFETLSAAGKVHGFEVHSVSSVLDHENSRISSTAIRTALKNGDLASARKLLGRPYAFTGHVQHGKKLGRTIGFPTLNLAISKEKHKTPPATTGIFIARVHGLHENPLPAVASLGVRPTVEDQGRVLLETHIFNFNESVYGKLIKVELIEKLRDEAKYPNLEALQEAIQADALAAINYFKNI
ncbi:bifunctional riboflavin kinase/FAD synthetase [Polynucleobacter kasalickyi]|uniref:Riboflavin biosynthesis protein n=1 Tax=Polynucleobacter kasalickyi TaxID=1938817 RepID=A0A1W1YHB3_9BURK|nr:bifunctional riboflavin kinase/FAD synthetase [Polynucleobacter kasalickyi]SMC35191.1 FMN adenylyltransferase /riboflavin kinase [Polynucleobacter kasalickyi]